MIRPYKKYGDYYIPGCNIAFPTEQEAWEYIENRQEGTYVQKEKMFAYECSDGDKGYVAVDISY